MYFFKLKYVEILELKAPTSRTLIIWRHWAIRVSCVYYPTPTIKSAHHLVYGLWIDLDLSTSSGFFSKNYCNHFNWHWLTMKPAENNQCTLSARRYYLWNNTFISNNTMAADLNCVCIKWGRNSIHFEHSIKRKKRLKKKRKNQLDIIACYWKSQSAWYNCLLLEALASIHVTHLSIYRIDLFAPSLLHLLEWYLVFIGNGFHHFLRNKVRNQKLDLNALSSNLHIDLLFSTSTAPAGKIKMKRRRRNLSRNPSID